MSANRCWECNTTFYSDYGAIYCNVCNQARKSREHNERQARQARWETEQANRENARIQAQHTQALINAENQRVAAINHQTRVIMESAVKPKEAYDRGYKYIDSELKYRNDADVQIEVNEYGTLEWKWNHPYLIPSLQQQFAKGLSDRMNQYKNLLSVLKNSACYVGKLNALGKFSSSFTLYTGLTIGGVAIATKSFNSRFTSTLDESNGELVMKWNKPFTNEELNQAYLDGVNEVHWEVNTDEKKNHRLRVEVPALKAERKITKATKKLDKFYKFLVVILPIVFVYIAWGMVSGWATTMTVLIFSIFIWQFLKKKHSNWAENNNEYLGKQVTK